MKNLVLLVLGAAAVAAGCKPRNFNDNASTVKADGDGELKTDPQNRAAANGKILGTDPQFYSICRRHIMDKMPFDKVVNDKAYEPEAVKKYEAKVAAYEATMRLIIRISGKSMSAPSIHNDVCRKAQDAVEQRFNSSVLDLIDAKTQSQLGFKAQDFKDGKLSIAMLKTLNISIKANDILDDSVTPPNGFAPGGSVYITYNSRYEKSTNAVISDASLDALPNVETTLDENKMAGVVSFSELCFHAQTNQKIRKVDNTNEDKPVLRLYNYNNKTKLKSIVDKAIASAKNTQWWKDKVEAEAKLTSDPKAYKDSMAKVTLNCDDVSAYFSDLKSNDKLPAEVKALKGLADTL